MQAILKGIIAAGVDVSCVNFSMRDMRNEIVGVERLIKVKEMRSEWEMRVKLETERKEMREKRESVKKLRDCRQIVWECVHTGMSESEKQKRMSMMREKEEKWKVKRSELQQISLKNMFEWLLDKVVDEGEKNVRMRRKMEERMRIDNR